MKHSENPCYALKRGSSEPFERVRHRRRSRERGKTTICDEDDETHDLALFRHQVAGHLPMFWQKGTICKPAFPIEIEFYASLPYRLPELMPFVPKFLDRVRIRNDPSEIAQMEEDKYNHWSLDLVQKHWKKIEKLDHQYIMLEDLTNGMKKPCIMDIKLGTRQHGLNDTPEKVKSKQGKVSSTTSKTLGLRLCGLQTYRPWERTYVFEDKYKGRALDDRGFEEMVKFFFHNGEFIRRDCVLLILDKLRTLLSLLKSKDSYLFYATSVLFVYEGFVSEETLRSKKSNSLSEHSKRFADMRMIDFAHTYPLRKDQKDTDSGILVGLVSLIEILEHLL